MKSMKKEVAVVEELKSVVKVLREDLTNTRQKCTKYELAVHDAENKLGDINRQLTMKQK